MAKVITMGEIMLRLSTPDAKRFSQTDSFSACYGGGEANVAVSLANYGHEVHYITKLPDNPLGECVVSVLRKMNVYTDGIAIGGERLGTYYLETGSSVRGANVVYDRKHSSMSEAVAEDFNLEQMCKGADLFHISGITPAISPAGATLTGKALTVAKKAGAKISFDVNYRSKLWSFSEAQKTLTEFMPKVDYFFGSDGDARMLLGDNKEQAFGMPRTIDVGRISESFERLKERYPNVKIAIGSVRESVSASDNSLTVYGYDFSTHELQVTQTIRIAPIVDRVGGGDALTGGALHCLLTGESLRTVIGFGAAASALKHTIAGDFNLCGEAEVRKLLNGDAAGLVQR